MDNRLVKVIALLVCVSSAHASDAAAPSHASVLKANLQYPADAVKSHHEGVAMVLAHVDASGQVAEARLDKTSGFPELDQAALSSVKAWSFNPATHDGRPVDEWVTLPVSLKLQATPSASPMPTPLEQAKLREWIRAQANPSQEFGFLFECKGGDGKFSTTRILGRDCVVHEQLGPYVVLSDSPTDGWRKVQTTSQADFYLDNSSFSYIDAQATPKLGAGLSAWFKMVYRKPQVVTRSTKKETFTTRIMSLSYGCKGNRLDYGVEWLYDADGKLVDAYPPSPTMILQPQDPMAQVLSSYCRAGT